MITLTVDEIAAFERVNLTEDSWARCVSHQFDEDTLIHNTHKPGLYISVIGQCQGRTQIEGMDAEQDFSHHYMMALLEGDCDDPMFFPKGSWLQMLSIMVPLETLNEPQILPRYKAKFIQSVPQIRLAELGLVPLDIFRCCDAVWHCKYQGLERELFLKAKAHEVMALFLHLRRKAAEQDAIDVPIYDTSLSDSSVYVNSAYDRHKPRHKKTKQCPQTTVTPQVHARMLALVTTLRQVENTLDQEWPLAKVARMAQTNEAYLKSDIKALVGTTFRQWLIKARLTLACRLLAENIPISEVAQTIGFKSPAYFATLFKSEMGVSPRLYRESLTHPVQS
ncbi:helix-turn-helix transcriptional regulator [Marinomonas mediterranea]|uniref:Transcriptional regulator, AraC family n=1 Tax=Marinomonas mediterranea (strain ATCC 700492 / JCM 21426 / NBRC 103028 / MMB-1) TaxID=717774 RepID=F2JYW9_MARM1|nr:AraC family transcriptional regulator [Marinomonas mediterranea]ADZ90834.1 transcriptional regulator, AraC family [Marinomonas mediterranea MMB-1]WCN16987.1 helix-turn-helix domain-containing protein [Marinomonas mediterranea MMB-1]